MTFAGGYGQRWASYRPAWQPIQSFGISGRSYFFTGNMWVMEALVTLSENNFEPPMPKPLEKEFHDVARMPKCTVSNERLFNYARLQERLQHSNKLGRVSRWHRATVSTVLEEMDRKQVTISEEDSLAAVGAPRLPQDMSATKHCKFSLGEKAANEMIGPTFWAAPRAEDMPLIPKAVRNLVGCQDSLGQLSLMYMALLCDKYKLIQHVGSDAPFIGVVLSVNDHAATVWRLRLRLCQ